MSHSFRRHLLASTLLVGGVVFTAPAFAQDASTAPASGKTAQASAPENNAIIVTGTLFRNPALTSPSPVTQITTANLDARGITTIQEGIQRIAANNGPALTNSFTANGAFASGASAVSLRGLTTDSTLVLFDGMRAAYYPLADDGTRNFVDLNTIPDDIVERIDVLRDGASATYGADAIAGVVNIITKKNFQGFSGRAEGDISSRGDGGQYRLSATAGIGDLDEKGFNAYISGFYYQQNALYNHDRGYPYNSDDYSKICHDGTCGANGVINGPDSQGLNGFGIATPFAVRPADAATGVAVAGSQYQYLAGCGNLPTYNLTAADRARRNASGALVNASAPNTVCQEDLTNLYGMIQPKIKRYGLSARVTARYGDTGEAYASFNFLQTETETTAANPATIRGNAPAPFYFPRYSSSANVLYYGNNTVLQLPVYVCPQSTIGACSAANGTLNPNNPFAAAGQTALLVGRLPTIPRDQTRTRGYRAAAGAHGTLIGDWSYNVNATAMHVDLRRKSEGYVYIQHLLDVIKDGSYNFIDPSQNSQSVNDYLTPTAIANSTSDLVQGDASISGKIIELPGGPLELAVGTSVRYEAVDSPSINSDINGGTERYFTLNGFATKGHRTVYSTYGELNAPVLKQVTVNVSGRYDKYPHGIDNFSPKAGVIYKPIPQVALKGTFSRGFRIPSFGEANATFPTTGYVNNSAALFSDAYLAQYGCSKATYSSCPTYIGSSSSYGATSVSNPNLKPEKSRNFTGGITVQPIRGVTLSADYYNIRKTNVITTANNAPAILAYYNGDAIPDGYTVIPDAPDINNPNAKPRIAFVQSGFINANKLKTSGLDFEATVNKKLTDNISFNFDGQATYILKLETVFPDGSKERYDGTLGNFNLTAGSGTPKWKANATAGFTFFEKYNLNATMNYFDGYDLSATDQGTGYMDCGLSDGSTPCRVKSYVTFDLNVQIKVSDKTTFYATVQNIADRLPSIDTVTYGAHAYNPIQGGEGIYGRYFKMGVKFGL